MIGWLSIFVGHFSIDGDGNFLPFDFDVVCKPFIVLVAGLFDVLKAVNTLRRRTRNSIKISINNFHNYNESYLDASGIARGPGLLCPL